MPFHFELVSPERLLFSGEVASVQVPGVEGDFTVLPHHAPVMTTLRPGVVEVGDTAGKATRLFVRGGFADVSSGGLTLLADTALPVEDLDAAMLGAEIDGARASVEAAKDEGGRNRAQDRLDRLTELRASLGL